MTPNNLRIREILLQRMLTEVRVNRGCRIHRRFVIFNKSNLKIYYSAQVALNVAIGNHNLERRSQTISKIMTVIRPFF
jgi:hypothetical protein